MRPKSADKSRSPTIAILGAGAAGLCMAIDLRRAGFDGFTIFEKADRVGGTWRDNTYPGSGCDVPSHLYCFSFEPKADWSHVYAEQPEIQTYLEHCAAKYDIRRHVRFGTEIAAARFDEVSGVWRLAARDGTAFEADVLIAGCGQLNRPHVPKIAGLESFAGKVFHSARWDHLHDLRERSVAVIGNGASAVQFVPRIAPLVRRLTIFQRSAHWLLPRGDRAYRAAEKLFFTRLPAVAPAHRDLIYLGLEARFLGLVRGSVISRLVERHSLRHMHAQIESLRLREALTPDYPLGCKRILISDDYYPALERPNAEVVTTPITRVSHDAVITSDGVARAADTIVFATGFEATSFLAPMDIVERGGQTLNDAWRDGAEAHLGMTVPGFPSLFLLYGPNTNLGHNSIIFMIECQARYVRQCVEALARRGASWMDVRRDVARLSNDRLQRAIQKTTWAAGCHSWYKTATGKVTNNWSGLTAEYWWRTRKPELADFEIG